MSTHADYCVPGRVQTNVALEHALISLLLLSVLAALARRPRLARCSHGPTRKLVINGNAAGMAVPLWLVIGIPLIHLVTLSLNQVIPLNRL